MSDRTDSKLATLARQLPQGWDCFRGVSGILYARRKKSSPPVIVRGATVGEVTAQITQIEEGQGQVNPAGQQEARERGTALADLRQHWDDFYITEWMAGEFWGTRRDTGDSIHRPTAGELHDGLLDDFVERPVKVVIV